MPRNRRRHNKKKKKTTTTTTAPPPTPTPTPKPTYVVPDIKAAPPPPSLDAATQAHYAALLSAGFAGPASVSDDEDDYGDGESRKRKRETDEEDESKGGARKKARGKTRKNRKAARTQEAVAALKRAVARPDLVEAHDVTGRDPRLLLALKAARNSVPVPDHWNATHKYLQRIRASDKVPYVLPDYIEATGISRVRQAFLEAEESKSMAQQARDRMRAKLGRLDMDYQVLHDAFFVHQTKPKLTLLGDTYYEGKDKEIDSSAARPGFYSQELLLALGMEPGGPPPWLINMQRYGPPPSYPSLKVPGVNAPLPAGASYGFEPGQWGMPPVDFYGQPLYGNVFDPPEDTAQNGSSQHALGGSRSWGELLDDDFDDSSSDLSSDLSSSDDDDDDDDENEFGDDNDLYGDDDDSDTERAPKDTSFVPGMAEAGKARPLYTELKQQDASVGASSLMGSAHTYVVAIESEEEERKLQQQQPSSSKPSKPSKPSKSSMDASNFKF